MKDSQVLQSIGKLWFLFVAAGVVIGAPAWSAMVPNDNSPNLLAAFRRVQIIGADLEDPFVDRALDFFGMACACRATKNRIVVRNADLADIGILGTLTSDAAEYCGGSKADSGRVEHLWLAIDLVQSGIRIIPAAEFQRLMPVHWSSMSGQARKVLKRNGMEDGLRRVAIMTFHVRDPLGRNYPMEMYLLESLEGQVVFHPTTLMHLPPGEGVPIPAALLTPEELAGAPPLVDDPRGPPPPRVRPVGAASQFQRQGSWGKWLSLAGIVVLVFGGIMAGRRLLGGGR
jgi:hypothetical protein